MGEFWRNPPWIDGAADAYRVGLTPAAPEDVLRAASSDDTAAKLERWQAARAHPVYASLPGTWSVQRQCEQFIDGVHAHRNPAIDAALPPLFRASCRLRDDLCLMRFEPRLDAYVLAAASLCAPSYWRLLDKLGAPLQDIHAPVTGLNAAIGTRIDEFFRKLPPQRGFARRNFFVHDTDQAYQPWPDTTDYAQLDAQDLYFRSEHQLLWRVDPQHVLFSIRISTAAFAEIYTQPQAHQGLVSYLQQLNTERAAAFGGAEKVERLLTLLA